MTNFKIKTFTIRDNDFNFIIAYNRFENGYSTFYFISRFLNICKCIYLPKRKEHKNIYLEISNKKEGKFTKTKFIYRKLKP